MAISLRRDVVVSRVFPALIFVSLWLDGWFFPLILLPFLYVFLVEKKDAQWLGFQKQKSKLSIYLGMLVSVFLMVTYIPVFLYYFSLTDKQLPSVFDVFTDVIWYPFYEEATYRSFFLVHFAVFDYSSLSKRNLSVNLLQSLLFLSIHGHHLTSSTPLVLVPVFFLALLNGFLFLRTRNIIGCLLSHCVINSFAWSLRVIL